MRTIMRYAAVFGLFLSFASCGTDINKAAAEYTVVLDKWIAAIGTLIGQAASAKNPGMAIVAADKAAVDAHALLAEMNEIDDLYPVSGKDTELLRAMLQDKYAELADLTQALGETVGGILARYAGDPATSDLLTKAFDPIMIMIPQDL